MNLASTTPRALLLAAAAAAAFVSAGPALAHHSFAMFDRGHNQVLTGTVREFQWTNPHSWIRLEVMEKGAPEIYSVELNSPNNLARQGWTSKAMKPGDKVEVTIAPLRDGTKGGLFVGVVLSSGKTLGDVVRRNPAEPAT